MVEGFNKFTRDQLTDDEEKAMDIIIKVMPLFVGKKKAVTNGKLVDMMRDRQLEVRPARIRKIMHVIRIMNYVPNVLANDGGYYVSENREDICRYVRSLTQRANSILAVAGAFVEYNGLTDEEIYPQQEQ